MGRDRVDFRSRAVSLTSGASGVTSRLEDSPLHVDALARRDPRWASSETVALQAVAAHYIVEARLSWNGESFSSLPALHSRRAPRALRNVHGAQILEALAVASSTHAAFELYMRGRAAPEDALRRLPEAPWREEYLEMLPGRVALLKTGGTLDLTQDCIVGFSPALGLLQRKRGLVVPPSSDVFVDGVRELVQNGLAAPPTGQVALGDLARIEPFCPRYGRSRGTIIDRYYLHRFVSTIQHLVHGRTVDAGTSMLTEDNKLPAGFPNMTEYRTLDLISGPGVDICGDIGNRDLLPRDSVDSILCFNVLEHCPDIQNVVDNMYRWLAVGGHAFCMVPSAQRVHEAPNDFWRPLPAGLNHLFRAFTQRTLRVYGNLQATIAALSALSLEDLSPGALDEDHPDYPVATCIVAVK
jgi:SAM-dependent methyltransferase